jgi:hypothetical protein
MFLRVDGVSMSFQGVKYGVITLMRTQQIPYLIKIHYMAHKTNLAMQKKNSCKWFPYWKISFNHYIGITLAPQNSHFEFTKFVEIVKT